MAAKSPTTSVKSREMIGENQFSQRREVFEKHDTVFLPLPSPTALTPTYKEVDPIITTNHGITTSNFKRNTPGYSSMRETRSEDRHYEYRPRKYSDNFTSELNQSDDVDHRYSMAERNRRLSKLRRDFLKSNLHEPGENTLTRSGVRASLPTTNTVSAIRYKIENLNIYKFPFAEPYSTPTPIRRVVVDLGSPDEGDGEGENVEKREKHQSLPNESPNSPKLDHQKLYEELVKRYSPQRKPVNWNLPPTRPKVVGSVPKSTSSAGDSIDSNDKKDSEALNYTETDDVFEKSEEQSKTDQQNNNNSNEKPATDIKTNVEILHNGAEIKQNLNNTNNKDITSKTNDSKVSLSELEENDYVPELSTVKRQLSRESAKKVPIDNVVDLTIPALIEKMTAEGEQIQNHKEDGKKVKRKRSFLDKLLGRNKGIKKEN
ncbi:probable serine/threonine-protein kinase DDB_G0278845 [Vanessa tameamea]|uniref:Probable serine/threonine-protein kinase DDB_G0278845 n=1 Tax=Vanessa tameamea TaxID=334116 RepID=A0A8B8IN83_VANTA|nr:probable serine/threonine-protein kinase DDB_G0278845 [Vanessa tameamea]